MTLSPGIDHPASHAVTYQLTVAGHLDDHWSEWLGGHALVRNDDASTTVSVDAADQAQLHGVLTGIRDLGVSLLALHAIDDQPVPATYAPVLERPLHTERLTLRPAFAADADTTWAYRRLDSVKEWLTSGHATVGDYRAMFVEPAHLSNTVIVELNHPLGGIVVGDFLLRREHAWSRAELGWVLDPAHAAARCATEAVGVLLHFCFDELEVHRVVAHCFLDNDTSWRLMERMGMRRETHAVSGSLHRSGRWLDTVGYAILAEEWKPRGG